MAFRWRANSGTILRAYWEVCGHWANQASIKFRGTIGPQDIILHYVAEKSDEMNVINFKVPGRVAQSVTCLAIDASLTADPGVASSIPAGPILSWRLIMK